MSSCKEIGGSEEKFLIPDSRNSSDGEEDVEDSETEETSEELGATLWGSIVFAAFVLTFFWVGI